MHDLALYSFSIDRSSGLLHLILEVRAWLKGRNLMLRNNYGCVLGDVTTGLSLSGLHLECAESAEIYILSLCH